MTPCDLERGGNQVVFKLTNDLSLTVAPAADPAAPRFFKVKASLRKE